MEDSFYPALRQPSTLRAEGFGGYLHAPRGPGVVELGTVEFRVIARCTGQHSISAIISELAALEGWTGEVAANATWEALRRFHSLGALEWLTESAAAPSLEKPPPYQEIDEAILGRALSAPLSVLWDITYACNLRCPHCLTASGRAAPDELSREEALQVVEELHGMRVFSITCCGGEPLLSPYIFDLVDAASRRGMGVNLDTNGLMVTPDLVERLAAAGVGAVQVSLDGREEVHDRFRGKQGSFAAAVRAIKLFREQGLPVSIAPVLTRLTHQDLEYLVELATDLGATSLKASLFLPTGRGRDNAEKLMLTPAEARASFRKLVDLKERFAHQLMIAVEGSYPGLNSGESGTGSHKSFAGAPVGCPAGVTQMVIGANGMVYACPFLYDQPAGDLRREPLAKIWRQARIFKIFRQMTKGQLKGQCRSCAHVPANCAGGCRAAAYALTGDLYGEDPLCWCAA
jgi:mycofactocin biosynthetic radical S-adenosylmethionine protein MftC